MSKDNNTCCPTSDRNVGKQQTAYREKVSLSGVKIDSTTAKVTSSTNPGLHVTVKVLHPSMLLAK